MPAAAVFPHAHAAVLSFESRAHSSRGSKHSMLQLHSMQFMSLHVPASAALIPSSSARGRSELRSERPLGQIVAVELQPVTASRLETS